MTDVFLRLGHTYYAELLVEDANGQRIDDDIPLMRIQNAQTKEYYNGVTWRGSETALALQGIGNGLYVGQFTPEEEGTFNVTLSSQTYHVTKIDVIEVYSSIDDKHEWRVDTKYPIEYIAPTELERGVYCTIASESSGKYYTGYTWENRKVDIPLQYLGNGKYSYVFTPTEIGDYNITIVAGGQQFCYILSVKEHSANIPPVHVSNYSLLSLDGSDSTVLSDKGVPIDKVSVVAYDVKTKEVVARTQTNSLGEWQMLMTPGTWQFVFEKDGYIAVSFERVVS